MLILSSQLLVMLLQGLDLLILQTQLKFEPPSLFSLELFCRAHKLQSQHLILSSQILTCIDTKYHPEAAWCVSKMRVLRTSDNPLYTLSTFVLDLNSSCRLQFAGCRGCFPLPPLQPTSNLNVVTLRNVLLCS